MPDDLDLNLSSFIARAESESTLVRFEDATDAHAPRLNYAVPLPGEKGYTYTSFNAGFNTDRRKPFMLGMRASAGQFFNGYRYGVNANIRIRKQPYVSVAMDINYNYIDLPSPHASTSLFLIGPRIDLTFSKNLFLTTFIQYNDQIDNLNINTRFQWRFAPVSDFFLVYTDNYGTDGLGLRNRALVGKVTYWLNL